MITKLITTIAVCLLLSNVWAQSDSCVPVLQAATLLPTKFGKLETGTLLTNSGIFDFVYTSPMSRYNYIQVPYKETHDEKNVEVGLCNRQLTQPSFICPITSTPTVWTSPSALS